MPTRMDPNTTMVMLDSVHGDSTAGRRLAMGQAAPCNPETLLDRSGRVHGIKPSFFMASTIFPISGSISAMRSMFSVTTVRVSTDQRRFSVLRS